MLGTVLVRKSIFSISALFVLDLACRNKSGAGHLVLNDRDWALAVGFRSRARESQTSLLCSILFIA